MEKTVSFVNYLGVYPYILVIELKGTYTCFNYIPKTLFNKYKPQIHGKH